MRGGHPLLVCPTRVWQVVLVAPLFGQCLRSSNGSHCLLPLETSGLKTTLSFSGKCDLEMAPNLSDTGALGKCGEAAPLPKSLRSSHLTSRNAGSEDACEIQLSSLEISSGVGKDASCLTCLTEPYFTAAAKLIGKPSSTSFELEQVRMSKLRFTEALVKAPFENLRIRSIAMRLQESFVQLGRVAQNVAKWLLTGNVADLCPPLNSGGQDARGKLALQLPQQRLHVFGSAVASADLRHRFDFAAIDSGARIIDASPSIVNVRAIQKGDQDSYLLVHCDKEATFIIGFSGQIFLTSVAVVSREFFSSVFRQIELYGADEYPSQNWTLLGILNTRLERAMELFDLNANCALLKPGDCWVRYLSVRMVAYHPIEEYRFCTLNRFQVFGYDVFQSLDDRMATEYGGTGAATGRAAVSLEISPHDRRSSSMKEDDAHELPDTAGSDQRSGDNIFDVLLDERLQPHREQQPHSYLLFNERRRPATNSSSASRNVSDVLSPVQESSSEADQNTVPSAVHKISPQKRQPQGGSLPPSEAEMAMRRLKLAQQRHGQQHRKLGGVVDNFIGSSSGEKAMVSSTGAHRLCSSGHQSSLYFASNTSLATWWTNTLLSFGGVKKCAGDNAPNGVGDDNEGFLDAASLLPPRHSVCPNAAMDDTTSAHEAAEVDDAHVKVVSTRVSGPVLLRLADKIASLEGRVAWTANVTADMLLAFDGLIDMYKNTRADDTLRKNMDLTLPQLQSRLQAVEDQQLHLGASHLMQLNHRLALLQRLTIVATCHSTVLLQSHAVRDLCKQLLAAGDVGVASGDRLQPPYGRDREKSDTTPLSTTRMSLTQRFMRWFRFYSSR